MSLLVKYKLAFQTPHCILIRIIRFFSQRKSERWIGVVGLEVHAQINSVSKLFSGADTRYGAPTNSEVAFFDAAIPGTLPVLNQKCVEHAVLTALALKCTVHSTSWFDRKHYFYSDLPAGYQITQQRYPFATNGELEFYVCTPANKFKPRAKTSKIKQIQLEQDSGKSLHDAITNTSFIDLNRAGNPLLEFVFHPDLSDGDEAASLIKELLLILRKLNTCSCKIEEGALRVDANVSVHRAGSNSLGIRSEVKNIASINGIAKAVDYELNRHVSILEAGGSIINETRAWDADKYRTVAMRDKEILQDYRFMPEPNLPPLKLSFSEDDDRNGEESGLINVPSIAKIMPELPAQYREKLCSVYGLSLVNAVRLMNCEPLLNLFTVILQDAKKRDPVKLCNILLIEFLHIIYEDNVDLENYTISVDYFGECLDLLSEEKINRVIFEKLLRYLLTDPSEAPSKVVARSNWWQCNDEEQIRVYCLQAVEASGNLEKSVKYKQDKYIQALLQCVLKVHQTVNLKLTKQIISDILKNRYK